MGILEMDFERILGVTFFHSSSQSIMLCGAWHVPRVGVQQGKIRENQSL